MRQAFPPLLFGVAMWLALPAWANVTAMSYVPTLDNASWQVQQARFSCRLRQPIPQYGDAVFEARAGGAQRFFLEPKKNPMEVGFGRLNARAPFWNPELRPVALGPVPVSNGKRPVLLDDALTQQLLKTLADGLAPEFEGGSRLDPEISVRVSLLPVRFRQAYGKYRDCVAQLPKQSREQMTTAVLAFEREQTELSRSARDRLDLLVSHAKESGKATLAIDALSADTPRRLENVRLAKERAAIVSDYLVGRGIAQSSLSSNYRGERDTRRQALVTVRLKLPDEE